METNNKLREALTKILNLTNSLDEDCAVDPVEIRDIAKDALAEPVKNCDVGDAADWEKRFGEECDKGHICSDCPVRYAKTRMAIELDKGARCEFVWAQMHYEEGGAK